MPPQLQTLVIVRHGKYVRLRSREELTPEGIDETRKLSKLLYKKLKDRKPALLCSTAPRAEQTAYIIANTFRVPCITHSELSLEDDDGDPYAIIHAHADKSSAIILVTHEPFSDLNVWFLDHEYGITGIPQKKLGHSHAKVTNCQTGQVTYLQPS